VIATHYFDGASYPVGSARVIAPAASRVIETAGGEVRTGVTVEQILVEGGRAVGVRLNSGEELRAPIVVSDVGARSTFLRLLPRDVELPFRAQLEQVEPGFSTAIVYLGLARSPRELDVGGEGERFSATDALADLTANALIYVCGPPRLQTAIREAAAHASHSDSRWAGRECRDGVLTSGGQRLSPAFNAGMSSLPLARHLAPKAWPLNDVLCDHPHESLTVRCASDTRSADRRSERFEVGNIVEARSVDEERGCRNDVAVGAAHFIVAHARGDGG
jgi:hypothetical protein